MCSQSEFESEKRRGSGRVSGVGSGVPWQSAMSEERETSQHKTTSALLFGSSCAAPIQSGHGRAPSSSLQRPRSVRVRSRSHWPVRVVRGQHVLDRHKHPRIVLLAVRPGRRVGKHGRGRVVRKGQGRTMPCQKRRARRGARRRRQCVLNIVVVVVVIVVGSSSAAAMSGSGCTRMSVLLSSEVRLPGWSLRAAISFLRIGAHHRRQMR